MTLEVVEWGARPELWRTYAVRGTPSMVVAAAGSARGVFLEGLSQEPALDEALARCRKTPPESSAPKEGTPK